MTRDQKATFSKVFRIILHAFPTLLAIALLELINAESYYFGPFEEKEKLFTAWNLLQLIPAFVFGYLSDRNCRKKALVISQALGLVGG